MNSYLWMGLALSIICFALGYIFGRLKHGDAPPYVPPSVPKPTDGDEPPSSGGIRR
jgi:hypothetical protein